MISRFCIHRPVFASVLSIIIVLVGVVALFNLPIDQYPDITPPTVTVSASYGGATADVTAESVATPLEQEVNGVPNMLYMTSTSSNGGSAKIKITFDVGTSPDFASIDVQNKITQATSNLPSEVINDGVTVEKTSSTPLLTVVVRSSEARFDDLYLSNFVTLNIQQALRRIPGVAKVRNVGARTYSMRVWLDPDALSAYRLTPTDVINAIKEQNANSAAGSLGAQPLNQETDLSLTINASGKLTDAEAFADIIVSATSQGALIRVRDVARVELGASAYTLQSRHNGESAAIASILLLPGSNALEVAEQVKRVMARLSRQFPTGIEYQVAYDASTFIKQSIKEVALTLIEALILVGIVVYLFLQNWRTTLIPMLAAPVSVVGTFVFMMAFGFTINTISLLALVLAIGLVVDDAIVVVENVQRVIKEKHCGAVKATEIAMKELTGALIATSLVLAAVFLPVAFLGGISGKLYREFAITLTVAVLISTFVALTLSPALCALLMKKSTEPAAYFRRFNQVLERITKRYGFIVADWMRRVSRSMLIFALVAVIGGALFNRLPVGFVPLEDQGTLYADIQLQPGSSVAATSKLVSYIEKQILTHEAVDQVITLTGENKMSGSGEENANFEIYLKPWEQREGIALNDIIDDIQAKLALHPQIVYRVFQPPAISGMGDASGFSLELQDRSGTNQQGLAELANSIVAEAAKLPQLESVSTTLKTDVPMLKLEVDREVAKTLGVSLTDLNSLLKQLTGSANANDFNMFGRTYKVKVQADADFRRRPQDLDRYYMRSASGKLIPLSMLARIEYGAGAGTITRHNLFTSASISGGAATGYSSGDAMRAMEALLERMMAPGFSYEWTGMSYQEQNVSGDSAIAMLLAIVFVYLFLAALYESWIVPVPVLLIVPVALAGSVLFVSFAGLENNIFFQISAVALVGLAAKNSILIVEFARSLMVDQNMSAAHAALNAAKQRFRPILMTSVSFILGIFPLVVSSGPGAQARMSISTGTLGGMIAATTLGILLVPVFFVVFMQLAQRFRTADPDSQTAEAKS